MKRIVVGCLLSLLISTAFGAVKKVSCEVNPYAESTTCSVANGLLTGDTTIEVKPWMLFQQLRISCVMHPEANTYHFRPHKHSLKFTAPWISFSFESRGSHLNEVVLSFSNWTLKTHTIHLTSIQCDQKIG